MFEKDSPNWRYAWGLQPNSENLLELRGWYDSRDELSLKHELDDQIDKKSRILRNFPELATGTYGPGHPQEFNVKHCDTHILLIQEALQSRGLGNTRTAVARGLRRT